NSGITNAVFVVSLSAPSGKRITVTYSTANGTAVGGSDFVPSGGTLTFLPGTTSQNIRVAVIGDRLSESNETYWVNLHYAVNASIARGQGMGLIVDDDAVVSALSINDYKITAATLSGTNLLLSFTTLAG